MTAAEHPEPIGHPVPPVQTFSDGTAGAGAAQATPGSDAVRPGRKPTLVDAVVARLNRLGEVPLVEHPDLYQSIHADLQSALAAIDDA